MQEYRGINQLEVLVPQGLQVRVLSRAMRGKGFAHKAEGKAGTKTEAGAELSWKNTLMEGLCSGEGFAYAV